MVDDKKSVDEVWENDVLSPQPIDYWRLIDDFARWVRPDLTTIEVREVVTEFLASRERPDFHPVHERNLVDSMHDVCSMFVPLNSLAGKGADVVRFEPKG